MTSVFKAVSRGAAAGAAATTALNIATWVDMAWRGRPASPVPATGVSRLADSAGLAIPGQGQERDNRLEGLGALGGSLTGIGVGALAGLVRAAGIRLPAAVGGPLLGAAAMAAGDLPITGLGVTDPRTWSAADWASDVIPHLVYGVTAHATLAALFRSEEESTAKTREEAATAPPAPRRPSRVTLLRAAALGAATGCRSSAGLTALALRSSRTDAGLSRSLAHPALKGSNVLLSAAEVGADKHPAVPSRLSLQGLAPRIALATITAGTAAHRDGFTRRTPVLVAAFSAVATAAAGVRLRELAADRFGSDVPGAIAEDFAAAALGWIGTQRAARPTTFG